MEKKGLGALIRPWTKRKFRFHEPLKILYYYDEQDELKGAVVLDDSKPIEVIFMLSVTASHFHFACAAERRGDHE